MRLRERIRTLFRLFLLFTVLVAVALISAITTIRLTIHAHQETMPNLVHLPLNTAERIASGLGLEIKVEDRLFSEKYPANQIVSQVPLSGARVKVGQHVHVLVSLGPPRVVVPNLMGASIRAAQITAVQRGLTVGDVAALHFTGVAEDEIVAQEPLPSTAQVHSPVVNFLISLGSPPSAYVCPSFIGMSLGQARRIIESSGFQIGHVSGIPAASARSEAILTQSPPPGSKIGPGTRFDFQIAEEAHTSP